MTHDLVRYLTGQTYYIPRISAARAFSLWWPVIGNLGVDIGLPPSSEQLDGPALELVDRRLEKAPLKKA